MMVAEGARAAPRSRNLPGVGVALFGSALLASCYHPLPASEVVRLTTCHNTDLKAARRSLLLNGFEIKSETDSDLVTFFKQVSGYSGRDRTLQRVSVVKLDDKTLRFKVRDLYLHITRDGDMPGLVRERHGRPGGLFLDLSEPVELKNEADEDYDEERLSAYEEMQRAVCGEGAAPPK